MTTNPKSWTQHELEKHSVDMRQFVDFRSSTLPNGSRIIDAYNASGLHFTVLPDRGMDIWSAHYRGIPLTWLSQGSPHPPDSGQTWLQQFNGGLLTTCGLIHAGPPETDDFTGEFRDLHGRYSRLRADSVRIQSLGWMDGKYQLELSGTVAQSRLFGEQLSFLRSITIDLDSPVIEILDQVVNVGDQPTPLMVLYHFNLGFPLVAKGTQLIAPSAVHPRDEEAREGLAQWATYDAPTPGYAEQVFFHRVKSLQNEQSNFSEVALVNGDFGMSFSWDVAGLPYLTQWKNTRQNIYVSGIEPGNCIPEGQNMARLHQRLQYIQPGEMRAFFCRLEVLDGAQAVAASKERIEKINSQGSPVDGCHLEDFAK
jgi:hypothetical protein